MKIIKFNAPEIESVKFKKQKNMLEVKKSPNWISSFTGHPEFKILLPLMLKF